MTEKLLKLRIQLFAEEQDEKPEKEETLDEVYQAKIAELEAEKAEAEKKAAEAETARIKAVKDSLNNRAVPKTENYTKKDFIQLSKDLAEVAKKEGVTNRDYVELSLKHRAASIEVLGKDPFELNGENSKDKNGEKVAKFLQKGLEEAKTPDAFRMYLESGIKDDPIVVSKVRAANAARK